MRREQVLQGSGDQEQEQEQEMRRAQVLQEIKISGAGARNLEGTGPAGDQEIRSRSRK